MAPRLFWTLTIALVFVMGLSAPAALADGDPASDVLLIRDVFFLYDPPPSSALQQTLNTEVAAARRAGFPIKVALIRGPLDLGLLPELFDKPQQYADFLGQEILRQYKGPLLVVMPNGYGVRGVSAAATNAVARLPKPASGQIDDLARAAAAAAAAIAAASGHPIATTTGGGSKAGTGGSSTALIVAIAAVAAIAMAALLLILRRRAAGRRSS